MSDIKALVHKLAAEWGLTVSYGIDDGEGRKQIKVLDGEGRTLFLSTFDRLAKHSFTGQLDWGPHAKAVGRSRGAGRASALPRRSRRGSGLREGRGMSEPMFTEGRAS